jgi:competence protein ComEA
LIFIDKLKENKMSFYRTLLAVVASAAIALPAFADDNMSATATTSTEATATQSATEANTASAEQIKVNLNKATVKELIKVKGLNTSKARSIVAYRKKHGDFKSTDELKQVKGFKKMKEENLKEISDQLVIE